MLLLLLVQVKLKGSHIPLTSLTKFFPPVVENDSHALTLLDLMYARVIVVVVVIVGVRCRHYGSEQQITGEERKKCVLSSGVQGAPIPPHVPLFALDIIGICGGVAARSRVKIASSKLYSFAGIHFAFHLAQIILRVSGGRFDCRKWWAADSSRRCHDTETAISLTTLSSCVAWHFLASVCQTVL